MNIKNYFFALYILFLLLCKKEIKMFIWNGIRTRLWFTLLLPFFLEKIAGGHNLPTVFLCWYNKHQNQVSLTTWNSKKKKVVFVSWWKNRKYLLFGQKALDLHNVFCGLILKTGKWLQIVNFFFSYMYHFDKALMSLIENRVFLQRSCVIFIPLSTYFWIDTILLLTADENSGWKNKILIV